MNAFADLLLSVLLGWLKGLTQTLWTFFAEGGSEGFLPWLGDHWKVLVLILCAAGVVMDFTVWNQRRRREKRAEAGREARSVREEAWGFDQAFNDSLEMRNLAFQEDGEARNGEKRREIFRQERKPLRENTEKRFYPVRGGYDAQEEQGSAPGGPTLEEYFAQDQRQAASGEKETRRRRSEKHESKERKRLFHRVNSLIPADEQENGLLDGLPPVIDKKEAFHKPVYPK